MKIRMSIRTLSVIALVSIIILIATAWVTYLADVPVAVVKGNSMLPLLREGDLVIIVRAPPGEINVGDIIVFKTPQGRLVVHRVIEIVEAGEKRFYVTMGDNNRFRDIYYPIGVPYEKVVGKLAAFNGAVFKIPYLGHLVLLFRN